MTSADDEAGRRMAALSAAVAALRDGEVQDAGERLVAVLREWPGDADALHFLGVLHHAIGEDERAIELLQASIEAEPGRGGYWNNLGNVLVSSRRFDEGADAYRRAAELAGQQLEAAEPLTNLSVLMRRGRHAEEARALCERALAVRPDFAEAWYNLSLALIDLGRIHEGLLANSKAILLWPAHVQARDQVIRALVLLGERERAAGLYGEWLAEEPDNPVALHNLAAVEGGAVPARASDAYVEAIFDGFAASFDVKLEQLHYRAPELVAQALSDVLGPSAATQVIVDLGCGTGLCGALVRPWARRLAGCDLSVEMLRLAKRRGVYDVLHKAELVYYLATQPDAFDAAICADTLCYFGDLAAVFAAAGTALRPGGVLVYTVEAAGAGLDRGYRLNPTGRYVHHGDYLDAAAQQAGLQSLRRDSVVLRTEAGLPVEGWLVTLRRPGA